MNTTMGAVLGFGMWTAAHIVTILGHRTYLINTGRALPNGFGPSRADGPGTWIGRVGQSHANCAENFPLFLGLASVSLLTEGPDVAGLAWYYVYARIGQSLAHWLGTSELLVTVRFLCFVTQLGLLGRMTFLTVYN